MLSCQISWLSNWSGYLPKSSNIMYFAKIFKIHTLFKAKAMNKELFNLRTMK